MTLVTVTPEGSQYVKNRRETGAAVIAEMISKLPPDEAASLKAAVPAIVHLRELYTQQRDPAPDRPAR